MVTSDRPIEVHEYHSDTTTNTVIIVLVILALAIIVGFWLNRTQVLNSLSPSVAAPQTTSPTNTTNPSNPNTNGASGGVNLNGSAQGTTY